MRKNSASRRSARPAKSKTKRRRKRKKRLYEILRLVLSSIQKAASGLSSMWQASPDETPIVYRFVESMFGTLRNWAAGCKTQIAKLRVSSVKSKTRRCRDGRCPQLEQLEVRDLLTATGFNSIDSGVVEQSSQEIINSSIASSTHVLDTSANSTSITPGSILGNAAILDEVLSEWTADDLNSLHTDLQEARSRLDERQRLLERTDVLGSALSEVETTRSRAKATFLEESADFKAGKEVLDSAIIEARDAFDRADAVRGFANVTRNRLRGEFRELQLEVRRLRAEYVAATDSFEKAREAHLTIRATGNSNEAIEARDEVHALKESRTDLNGQIKSVREQAGQAEDSYQQSKAASRDARQRFRTARTRLTAEQADYQQELNNLDQQRLNAKEDFRQAGERLTEAQDALDSATADLSHFEEILEQAGIPIMPTESVNTVIGRIAHKIREHAELAALPRLNDPSLDAVVDRFKGMAFRRDTGRFVPPTEETLDRLYDVVQELWVRREIASASELAGSIGYEISQLEHEGVTHVLLAERPESGEVGGHAAVLFNFGPSATLTIFEVPHPISDLLTLELATAAYKSSGAAVLLFDLSHRSTNGLNTADDAHQRYTFQVVHESLAETLMPVVQLHGYSKLNHRKFPTDTGVVLSSPSQINHQITELHSALEAAGVATYVYLNDVSVDQDVRRHFNGNVRSSVFSEIRGRTNIQALASKEAGQSFAHVEVEKLLRQSESARNAIAVAIADAARKISDGLKGTQLADSTVGFAGSVEQATVDLIEIVKTLRASNEAVTHQNVGERIGAIEPFLESALTESFGTLLSTTASLENHTEESRAEYIRATATSLAADAVATLRDGVSIDKPLIIAVLDSGVAPSRVANRLWDNPDESINEVDDDNNGIVDDEHGANFHDLSSDITDKLNHGATIATAIVEALNAVGLADFVRILPLVVTDDQGNVDPATVAAALRYAIEKEARIVTMAFKLDAVTPELSQTLEQAAKSGILFVVAAGNGGDDGVGDNIDVNPIYPAALTNAQVVTVTSVTPSLELPAYANYGQTKVDVAAVAPGGTSFAVPGVAAELAALILENPTLPAATLVDQLIVQAQRVPSLEGKIASGGVVRGLATEAHASIERQATTSQVSALPQPSSGLQGWFSRAFKKVVSFVSNVVKKVVSSVTNVVKGIAKAISDPIGAIKATFNGIKELITNPDDVFKRLLDRAKKDPLGLAVEVLTSAVVTTGIVNITKSLIGALSTGSAAGAATGVPVAAPTVPLHYPPVDAGAIAPADFNAYVFTDVGPSAATTLVRSGQGVSTLAEGFRPIYIQGPAQQVALATQSTVDLSRIGAVTFGTAVSILNDLEADGEKPAHNGQPSSQQAVEAKKALIGTAQMVLPAHVAYRSELNTNASPLQKELEEEARKWLSAVTPLTASDLDLPAGVQTAPGHFEFENAAVFAALNQSKEIIIAFRGTDELVRFPFAEFLAHGPVGISGAIGRDVQQWFDIKTHYDLLEPFVSAVKEYIVDSEIKRVRVTGHSLGGAVVQLFMQLDAHIEGVEFTAVTFGSPGAPPEFAEHDNRVIHYADVRDPVVIAPLQSTALLERLLRNFPNFDFGEFESGVSEGVYQYAGKTLTLRAPNDKSPFDYHNLDQYFGSLKRNLAEHLLNEKSTANNEGVVTIEWVEDVEVPIVLVPSSGELGEWTYTIKLQPSNGTLGGPGPIYFYQPSPHFSGDDRFTVEVQSESGIEEIAVKVHVRPINDAPVASNDTFVVDEDGTLKGHIRPSVCESYARLFSEAPAPEVLASLEAAGRQLQPVHDVVDPIAYVFDNYEVTVRLPAGLSAEQFLGEMARDLNGTVSNSHFDWINEFETNSNPSIGDIYHIDIVPNSLDQFVSELVFNPTFAASHAVLGVDNGEVMLTQLKSDRFVFSTLDGHPEYGSRAFGFEQSGDLVTFYTRGLSRPENLLVGWIGGPYQDRAWKSLVNGIGNVIAERGGEVVELPARTINRISAELVQSTPVPNLIEQLCSENKVDLRVTDNDVDFDGDELVITVTEGPGHGSLDWNQNGAFTYLPEQNYFGSDSFTYVLSDGQAETGPVTAAIEINPVNDKPKVIVESSLSHREPWSSLNWDAIVDAERFANPNTPVHWRSNANGLKTVWLHDQQSISLQASVQQSGWYELSLFVSNDGPTDKIKVFVNGNEVKDVSISNTKLPGDRPGEGWNNIIKLALGVVKLQAGANDITLVATTDAYGTEIDAVEVRLLEPTIALGSEQFTLPWNDVDERVDSTFLDSRNEALIVGGTVHGPTSAGSAKWVVDVGDAYVEELSFSIDTLGHRWWGKGLHGHEGSKLQVVVNGAVVHELENTQLGLYGDFWAVPPGSQFVSAQNIDLSPHGIRGPNITLELRATTGAVIDVHVIDVVLGLSRVPGSGGESSATSGSELIRVSEGEQIEFRGTFDDPDEPDSWLASVDYKDAGGVQPIEVADDKSFDFSKTFNDAGLYSARVTVTDEQGDSGVAQIDILVNRSPGAVADKYFSMLDMPLYVGPDAGVLMNDNDPDGDLLVASISEGPSHGNVRLDSDGRFTYEPALGFYGSDSFTYISSDGLDQSEPTVVEIEVMPNGSFGEHLAFEAESLVSDGSSKRYRSNASGRRTVHFDHLQTQRFVVNVSIGGTYQLSLTGSNDGPTNWMHVNIDDQHFEVELSGTRMPTDEPGDGWNRFASSYVGRVYLTAGRHFVTLSVSAHEFGHELDRLDLFGVVGESD